MTTPDHARFARLLQEHTAALVRLIEDTSVTEILFEDAGARIHIRRELPAVSEPPATAPAVEEPLLEPAADPALHTVTAPVVGKFRLATGMENPLQPGHRIEVDDQLGLIESMRVPHEIHAGVAGVVVEVLVQDGQPVEYGQPLFVLRKDTSDNE
jgi:oxaloacetate decarboxylase alpha subunit